ncbi:hypothetical protein ScPMuIL_014307, partial [Solemya velum]
EIICLLTPISKISGTCQFLCLNQNKVANGFVNPRSNNYGAWFNQTSHLSDPPLFSSTC